MTLVTAALHGYGTRRWRCGCHRRLIAGAQQEYRRENRDDRAEREHPATAQALACLRNQLRCTGYRERPATKRSARLSDQGKTRSAGDWTKVQ